MSAHVKHHHLKWIDRNARDRIRHFHQWQPFCSCGDWIGVPRKTRKRGREDFDSHLKQRNGIKNPGGYAHRQPLTPRADLPEALR